MYDLNLFPVGFFYAYALKLRNTISSSTFLVLNFPFQRNKTHKDTHGRVSDDESLACRWHQFLMRLSVQLLAPVATVASIPGDAI